jgi:signal transduction histidine kinase
MKNNWLHKILNSVFLKLLLVIVTTGVCINLLVGGFFMYFYMDSMKNAPFRKNVVQYLEYLINDFGPSPDSQKAKEISQKLNLEIRYEGSDKKWTTSEELPPVNDMKLRKINERPLVYIGRSQGKSFIVFRDGQNQYTFDFVKSYEHQSFSEIKILLLIVLLTGMFVCVYFVIRRILKPIKLLNKGVEQVSSGNLDYLVPVKKSDELGNLADAFNLMIGRIREMLHSREQLLLNVSHELRSPLTRMKVALEFLPENSAKKNLSEDISEMETMISEILETERLKSEYGQLNLQPTELANIVEEVIAMFKHAYPDFIYENKAGKKILNIDRQRIKTVINNLLTNAIKYSENASEPVRILLEQKEADIVIQIKDSGKGIPEDDLQHIFEPFYRVDKSRNRNTGGYGLGLSLCKIIIETHKGKIEVGSKLGKGTVVKVLLPIS